MDARTAPPTPAVTSCRHRTAAAAHNAPADADNQHTVTAAAAPPEPPASAGGGFATLFDFLPIGAYRSLPDGTQLRANPALVRLNGYDSEAQMLAAVRDIAVEWYVERDRRAQFREALERDGQVLSFVSEVFRHRSRERIWVSENAHVVRDASGAVAYYEGTVEEITHRVREQAALRHSEEELRRITAHMPGAAFRMRVSIYGVPSFSFFSAGVQALLGVSPQALLADGELLLACAHADDRPVLAAALRRAGDPDRALRAEFRVAAVDAVPVWVELDAPPSAQADGARFGLLLDVSQRKAAQAALRASDERWKLALESTGDGVWDWDLKTGRETLSARALQMYGFEEGELAEHAEELDRRTHPDDVPQMRIDREDHFSGRTAAYVNEHRVQHKDGSWKWVLSRGMVIARAADGTPLRMIGTHTDISARKQAQALQLERDAAAAAELAMTDFLSRVSHELRTPLNAVLGFAQLLQLEAALAPRHRGWVDQILGSGRHLLGLVDDVLDLSSLRTGRVPMALVEVEPGAVVEEAWSMLAADAQAAGLAWSFVPGAAGALRILADRRRLRQVLSNLLSNAIKYNRPGGGVTASVRAEVGFVAIAVEDTGIGMDESQLARLFVPFDRLGAQHGAVRGTGLGLALTRQLVETMGGTIGVHSAPGRGSSFVVRLPAAQSALSDART